MWVQEGVLEDVTRMFKKENRNQTLVTSAQHLIRRGTSDRDEWLKVLSVIEDDFVMACREAAIQPLECVQASVTLRDELLRLVREMVFLLNCTTKYKLSDVEHDRMVRLMRHVDASLWLFGDHKRDDSYAVHHLSDSSLLLEEAKKHTKKFDLKGINGVIRFNVLEKLISPYQWTFKVAPIVAHIEVEGGEPQVVCVILPPYQAEDVAYFEQWATFRKRRDLPKVKEFTKLDRATMNYVKGVLDCVWNGFDRTRSLTSQIPRQRFKKVMSELVDTKGLKKNYPKLEWFWGTRNLWLTRPMERCWMCERKLLLGKTPCSLAEPDPRLGCWAAGYDAPFDYSNRSLRPKPCGCDVCVFARKELGHLGAFYHDTECQRKDWKQHKQEPVSQIDGPRVCPGV